MENAEPSPTGIAEEMTNDIAGFATREIYKALNAIGLRERKQTETGRDETSRDRKQIEKRREERQEREQLFSRRRQHPFNRSG